MKKLSSRGLILKMSPELTKLIKKVNSFKKVLTQNGFEELQFFWYSDGFYNSMWNNMSVASERPDREESLTMWQFGFRSQNKKHTRMHLEALIPVAEEYFVFEIRYYPNSILHKKKNYAGPTIHTTVSSILEEDLTNLQTYINYLLNLTNENKIDLEKEMVG